VFFCVEEEKSLLRQRRDHHSRNKPRSWLLARGETRLPRVEYQHPISLKVTWCRTRMNWLNIKNVRIKF